MDTVVTERLRIENLHINAVEDVLHGDTWEEVGRRYEVSSVTIRYWALQLYKLLSLPPWVDESYVYHDYQEVNQARLHKEYWLKQLKTYRAAINACFHTQD